MVFSRNRFDAARLFSSSVAPLASEGRWRDFESDNPVAFFIQIFLAALRAISPLVGEKAISTS
jgi:hypothetical protein